MVGGEVPLTASSLTVDRVIQVIYSRHPPIRGYVAGADSGNRVEALHIRNRLAGDFTGWKTDSNKLTGRLQR